MPFAKKIAVEVSTSNQRAKMIATSITEYFLSVIYVGYNI
jgi:hypothetical protein